MQMTVNFNHLHECMDVSFENSNRVRARNIKLLIILICICLTLHVIDSSQAAGGFLQKPATNSYNAESHSIDKITIKFIQSAFYKQVFTQDESLLNRLRKNGMERTD